MRSEPTGEPGTWFLTAPSGQVYLLDDLRVTGSAGDSGSGWWLQRLLGQRCKMRYQTARGTLERMSVGTFARRVDAVAAAGGAL
jgi:hypothetical protein